MRCLKYYKSHYSRFGIAGVINVLKANMMKSNSLIKVDRQDIVSPIYLRLNTSDIPTFDQVFINQEYNFATSKPPNIIVDAGANIGLSSVYFASRYPESRIISIEPEKSNFELLKKNVAPYPNIIPLQAALWDKNEEISLVDPGFGKWGFMTVKKENQEERLCNLLHQVPGMTVDRIMQDYSIPRIDILKIDIEGAEREVFHDTSLWIEKVDVIIVELHESMKPGCIRSFYTGARGFDSEWRQGENVYLSRNNCMIKHSV